jgi:hypothetical protein
MSIKASNNVFPHDPDDNFLEKGGYTGKAKDLDDKINKIIYPDAFLKTTPPTKIGSLITINALDFKWRLNQIEYVNSNNYGTTIENATIGYNRIDIIVATKYSNFVKIQGVESIDTALEPPIPEGTLKAAFISVFGDTILDVILPIDGDIFVKKQESQDFIANYGATTVIDKINLIDNRSSISLIGSATDVKSVQLSGEFIRPGKPHFFKNRTGHDVKLWHLAGTGNIKYFFPNGLDLIVKPNEVIQFNTNANDSGNVRFEYVGGATAVDVSGKEDSSNKSTSIITDYLSNVKFPSVKAVYDWATSLFRTWILGINSIPGITYTIGVNDYKKSGVFSNANPVAFTVPTNASTAIPIGTPFKYTVQGIGTVTVGGAGITFIQNNLVFVTGNSFYLEKVDTDTWKVFGSSPVSGAKTPNTYFVNVSSGSNATGVFEDYSKPFATIDYILGLGTLPSEFIIYIQTSGTYPINVVFPIKNISFYSDYACTIDFSGAVNSNLLASTSVNVTIRFLIPLGKINVTTSTCYFNSINLKMQIQTLEFYSSVNQSFFYSKTLKFDVAKATIATTSFPLVRTDYSAIAGGLDFPINIGELTCLSASSILVGSGIRNIISIGLINGTGSLSFQPNRYNVGDISTTGMCSLAYITGGININFINSVISSAGGFQIGSQTGGNTLITGNIVSCPIIKTVNFSTGTLKLKDFSANFGTGTITFWNGSIIIIENSIIKCNGSLFNNSSLGGANTIKILNSIIEMVTPSVLCTGQVSNMLTVTTSQLSTNASAIIPNTTYYTHLQPFTNY